MQTQLYNFLNNKPVVTLSRARASSKKCNDKNSQALFSVMLATLCCFSESRPHQLFASSSHFSLHFFLFWASIGQTDHILCWSSTPLPFFKILSSSYSFSLPWYPIGQRFWTVFLLFSWNVPATCIQQNVDLNKSLNWTRLIKLSSKLYALISALNYDLKRFFFPAGKIYQFLYENVTMSWKTDVHNFQ